MEKGMIKVSVLYPNGNGKHFDFEYYKKSHIPLVSKTLGNALKDASYDKGIAGGAPDVPAPFVAIANLYFDSIEAFQQSFAVGASTLMDDLPNFTDIEPQIQISEIVS